ncbi:asparaginyl-tRNA synthetase [Lithohypha guttulata]|uniref:asparaginyl-tRNA synthetase n=1 Tax=Lithohypha guttulata TaxID=1690604 RepID=UPI002DDFF5B7|nr:asparaginyl-tRNA synthetase [Lithohypha guttulata]
MSWRCTSSLRLRHAIRPPFLSYERLGGSFCSYNPTRYSSNTPVKREIVERDCYDQLPEGVEKNIDDVRAVAARSDLAQLVSSKAALRQIANGQEAKRREIARSKEDTTEGHSSEGPPDELTSRSWALGDEVQVTGLVQSIRRHKKIAFANISDGKTYQTLQIVLLPKFADKLHNGAYVELKGMWQESKGSGHTHELLVKELIFVGSSDLEASPIQKKNMTVDHLRTFPHLRLRIPSYSLVNRVRSHVTSAVHNYYSVRGACYVQPPLITSSDCEGAGETFTITPRLNPAADAAGMQSKPSHYFRSPKYMTVSSQLHLEAFAAELGDVWTLSPTFRAEQSDTSRHLSEFWMLEAEFRQVTEVAKLTEMVADLMQKIIFSIWPSPVCNELRQYWSEDHNIQDKGRVDLDARWNALASTDAWKTVTYSEAMGKLKDAAQSDSKFFEYKPEWNQGLQLEHERWIVENIGKNYPVFVTNYPKKQKPFYMLSNEDKSESEPQHETVACFDLLLPYGAAEVVGGSLREHRLEPLIANMREKGLLRRPAGTDQNPTTEDYPFLQPGESLNTLKWYADLRRFGSSPHGGFGIGFDRLLMYLTGINNVRDIVPFPRTFGVAHC